MLATIIISTITLLIGAWIQYALERRPRLIFYLSHISAHQVKGEGSNPIGANTHSMVLKNTGRGNAHNVRLTHFALPDFSVYPSIDYTTKRLENGSIDIVFPILVHNEQVNISYLYFPPKTLQDYDVQMIKSDEGMAKLVNMPLRPDYPVSAKLLLADSC